MGHGNRHLGGPSDANGRPYCADREWSRRSIVRHVGHRHWHLYGHGAGRCGHARRADILQTHGYKANVLACVLRPWLGVPWIAFLHGETSENWKVRTYFRLEGFAVRRADRIVAVSEAMARRLVREGVDSARVRVVHNACLISSKGLPDGEQAVAPAPATVGVVARLSPEKGVDLALRAYAVVRGSCPDTKLIIAGEGPERARLNREE